MIASIFLAFVALGIALGVLFVGYGGVFLMIIGVCCASALVPFFAPVPPKANGVSKDPMG